MERRTFLKSLTTVGLLSLSDLACLSSKDNATNRRKPRHLLIAYSWGTADLGGIGIVPGLLNLIKKAGLGVNVTVLDMHSRSSSSHKFLVDYLPRFLPGCRVMPNPFSKLRDSNSPGPAWRAFCKRWGGTKIREFEEGSLSSRIADRMAKDVLDRFAPDVFRQLEQDDTEAARAVADAGFLLYASGTTLNFGRAGQRQFWSSHMSVPLLVARALRIPYGIGAQSFDAVEWPVDLIYRPLFKDARFVFCRDTDSLEYLKQRNLLNARSGFRPDSTFFFNGSDDRWAETFMSAHGLKERGFMVVIGRFAESKGPISGALTTEREQQHLQKYKRLIEGWIERTGLPVVICPEAKSEAPILRKKLHSILSPSAQQKCLCMDSFWTPEQACSLYRRARIVVGHMHTMIFALSVGAPVLHIPYAEAGRKSQMIADVGLGDWLLDIDETPAETLLDTALQIHRQHDAARQRVQKALVEVERLGLDMMAEVKRNWRQETRSVS